MERRERIALIFVILILVGFPAAILGYQRLLRPSLTEHRVIEITAAVPEAGGFQPAAIKVGEGETVTLRFSAVDVTHGIAIGPGLSIDLGHVDPGQVREVTLTFDKAGVYTFYCNTWCSPAHWRMRGVLEVGDSQIAAQPDPVIEALIAAGVNIDQQHATPDGSAHDDGHTLKLSRQPSPQRGAERLAGLTLPLEVRDPLWRRSHTPREALQKLTAANPKAAEADLIDVIAYLWLVKADTAAKMLYDKNCAACHGEKGAADGPAAKLTVQPPTAFADTALMFTLRSDVLYAKIRRGGMGTDMPNFGTVFTPDETWVLVGYLWGLAFPGE